MLSIDYVLITAQNDEEHLKTLETVLCHLIGLRQV